MPLKFAKPERKATVWKRKARKWAIWRAQCRAAVFEREGGRCQRCHRFVSDHVPECADNRAHVHEVRPRSLGGDPLNPDECELLCKKCHIGNGVHRVERTA